MQINKEELRELLKDIPFTENGEQIVRTRDFESSFMSLFNTYDSIVFYDTETTGLDAKGIDEDGQPMQIIELAALKVELEDGKPMATIAMDEFIQMNNNGHIPQSIIDFNCEHETGINDEKLNREGIPEKEAAQKFVDMVKGNTLLVAYNAQFDMCFVNEMLQRCAKEEDKNLIEDTPHIDPLTIFKDRTKWINSYRYSGGEMPADKKKGQKLTNAISYYGIDDYVKNSHRAIDDVLGLYAVFRKMDEQSANLTKYVNVIGYNPVYGINGTKHSNITYCAQPIAGFEDSNKVYSIVPKISEKMDKIKTVKKLSHEIATYALEFNKELAMKEIETQTAVELAKLSPRASVESALEKLVSKKDFPNAVRVKKAILFDAEDFKSKIESNERKTMKLINAFLKEVEKANWCNPQLIFESSMLNQKIDELMKDVEKDLDVSVESQKVKAWKPKTKTYKNLDITNDELPF